MPISAPAVLDAPPARRGAVRPPSAAPAWTPQPIPAGQLFRLDGVSWEQYLAIADALPNRNAFVTFDNGRLQLMTHGPLHEDLKTTLDRFLIGCDEVCDVPLSCLGNATLRREEFFHGFEPDNCYYVDTDLEELHGLAPEELPAPDLAVEVEVTRDVLNRLPLFAAVGVGEVWRVNGETGVVMLQLLGGAGGRYEEIEESALLPGVTPELVWDALTTVPRSRSVSRFVKAVTAFLRKRLSR
ncbi:MAG: Uma2 family endonuclease [Planctomycetota bacterium]